MKAELLAYTPNPEVLCARAASVSWRFDGLKNITDIEVAREILKRVISYGHESVIEHANFTFMIEGVSRAMTHQLVRHRIASFTQQSQRYVDLSGKEDYFVVPESMRTNELKGVMEKFCTECAQLYTELVKSGIPAEDARFVLPNATQTKIVVTMNARELRHFFNLRCCYRAQWEIREVAWEMLRQCKEVAPSLFRNAGPSCVGLGRCPEGALSCGKMQELTKWRDEKNE